MEDKQQAELLKAKGNECFQNNKFHLAVEYYTKAIELDPKNPVWHYNMKKSPSLHIIITLIFVIFDAQFCLSVMCLASLR
jgi:tetratricopeptide (TPR) repeat protein